MAEASNGRVTITLGGGGQVVKRAVSDVGYSDSLLGSGGKRSVRDRLGGDAESSISRGSQLGSSRRQRGDSYLSASNASGIRDARIGKDDLRFKLLQKNVGRRAPSDDDPRDLRDKISRKTQTPSHSPSIHGMQGSMVDPRETSLLGRIPPTRGSSEVSQMGSSRSSYSPWTLDHIRRRSPGRIITSSMGPERAMCSSREFSPPRRMDELQQRSLNRPYDDDLFDAPRPGSSSTRFMSKTGLPTVSANSAAVIPAAIPPPISGLQKQTYVAEEPQTIEGLLHSLGLGKYIVLFKAEEVDMTVLKQMGESDLKELGIPMGPRKKILLSVLPRSKR
ncbi:SEC23-interacting protein [Linum perenne]